MPVLATRWRQRLVIIWLFITKSFEQSWTRWFIFVSVSGYWVKVSWKRFLSIFLNYLFETRQFELGSRAFLIRRFDDVLFGWVAESVCSIWRHVIVGLRAEYTSLWLDWHRSSKVCLTVGIFWILDMGLTLFNCITFGLVFFVDAWFPFLLELAI